MSDFASDDDLFADDEAFQIALEGDKKLQAHCFECPGKLTHAQLHQDFLFESVLRQRGMDLVFNNPNYYRGLIEKGGGELVLFGGAKFNASSAFLENMEDFFQMARKLFIKNEKDAVKHLMNLNLSKGQYFDSRQKINLMFEYFTTFIQSLQTDEKFLWILEERREILLQLLESWTILFQGLTNIEFNLLAVCPDALGNRCRLPMHHLLHLHLELRWHYLCLLHALTTQKTEMNRLLENALEHILCELIKLAEGVKQEDFDTTQPFFCNCMREFWLMLQIFADKLHANHTMSMSFWGLLRGIVTRIFNPSEERIAPNISKPTRLVLCENWTQPRRYSFTLWMFLNICPLYGYSENGIYSRRPRGQMSDEASNLLELILKKLTADARENDVRELMRLLLQLPLWWNIGMQALNLLLDHFIKNINSTFMTPGENPAHLAFMAKTVVDFSVQIKGHLRVQNVPLDSLSSFHLFLKFLASQIKNAWSEAEKLRFFNQMKGRICTKFTPGRVLGLSEVGFYNLTSLCLTIGLSIGLEEMSNKLQGFLTSADKVDVRKKVVIFISHMTLIYLRAESNIPIEENIPHVTKMMNSCCKDFNKNNLALLDMISSFVESLIEVSDVLGKDEISCHLFLGEWLPEYLAACNATRSARVLTAMQDIASKLPFYEEISSTAKRKQAVASFLLYLMPYLKQESVKVSPASYNQIADIAYAISAAAVNPTFLDLFKHFATNETVHVGITARYLSHVASSEEVIERVKSLESKFDEIILHEWMRCCVLDESNSTDTESITRLVCNLPDLKNLFGDQLAYLPKEAFPLEMFGEKIAEQYDLRRENILERSEFKHRVLPYFKKLPLLVSHVIQRDGNSKISTTKYPVSTVIRMYECIGSLFVTCSPVMMQEKDARCPLILLANSMLLYEDVTKYPSFAIDPTLKAALEAHFHKFLIGLGKILKNDGYVSRLMVAIVKHFIHALDPKGNVLSVRGQAPSNANIHPIERVFRTNNPELIDKLAEIIGSQMLKMRGKFFECEHAPKAIRLLLNVLEYSFDDSIVASLVKHTLKETLLILMQIDDRKESEKILTFEYFKAIVKHPAFESADVKNIYYTRLAELYRDKMAFQDVQLFQLLYILAKYKITLIKPTIRKLEEQIAIVEQRRQIANDNNLRKQMNKLMRMLGPVDDDDFQFGN